MTSSRLLAALAVLTPLFIIAITMLRAPATIDAQIAPVPTPAALAATPANGLPQLLPAPGVVQASPAATATARMFSCSCGGAGVSVGGLSIPSGTAWMGRLSAPTFFAARQSAASQCEAYLRSKTTQSAFIPSRAFSFAPTPLPIPTPLAAPCQRCTCD